MIITDTESADIDTPTGLMRTYLFRPVAEGRYPGLVLFSEIFQVTGPIRRTATMLASHGFVVAVPEIYHELEPPGTVLAYDEAGAERGNRLRPPRHYRATMAMRELRWIFLSPHRTAQVSWVSWGCALGGIWRFARRCSLTCWPPPASTRPIFTSAAWARACATTVWTESGRSRVSC